MREKLMQSLRLALSNQDVTDVDEADLLLAEITGESDSDADADALLYELNGDVAVDGEVLVVEEGDGLGEMASGQTHYTPDPNICHDSGSANLHSIPDSQSPPITNLTITNVTVTIPSESNTCVSTSVNPNIETPPLSVSNGVG
jgi:hypothetical protein